MEVDGHAVVPTTVVGGQAGCHADGRPVKRQKQGAMPADADGGDDGCASQASSELGLQLPPAATPSADWAPVIEQVKSAIVAIRVTGVRPFEDSSAGVWQGTGFVVSLEDPQRSLILTNRHIISTGPIRAFATFDEHEELPVFPVYRDPIHDFGLLQFDSSKLRFTPARRIELAPELLRVGAEVLVIGNDNAEKIQILPATIARVDRNSPTYSDGTYQDENTFYAGAGSNTSGGSSGSPVIDRSGACIGVNAGGATEAASAYYLPLDRVVYVLEWLRSNPGEPPLPPRGTLLTKFLFQPFDMLRKLGFAEEQEHRVLQEHAAAAATAVAAGGGSGGAARLQTTQRPKGMLVVDSFSPSSQAETHLKPGDVLLEVRGKACLAFSALEDHLDSCVGGEARLLLSRAGKEVEANLRVEDLHALIPHDFAECAAGVFHQVCYHTCKRYHLPVQDRGMFVSESGFGFGLELPYHAVVTAVQGKNVGRLEDFAEALSGVADGQTFEVSWFNPTTNERRTKRSSVRMERSLWPLCTWRFSPERPNVWHRQAVPEIVAPPAAADGTVAASPASSDKAPATAEDQPLEESRVGEENSNSAEDSLGYPPSRDATIGRVQPMICTVTTRVAHEFATDFIQSEDERNSTLVRRFGVGLVVDAERGLVVTDRYVVPQSLAQVELTFAQIVTTDAKVLFIHPQHNIAVLQYDVAAVRPLPVQSLDFSAIAGGTESAADGEAEELAIGEIMCYVSLHGDHRISAKQTTVGSIYLKAWHFCEPPAYRERNLEICNLNDTLQGLGGLLVEPGSTGRTRAWFAQFPAGKKHYLAGVPLPVLVQLLRPLGLAGGPAPPQPLHLVRVSALDCEFEELSLAKARRYHGMTLEQAAHCCDGRRLVLMLSRVTAGGAFDGELSEGDVVLKVAGEAATRPQDVERLMEQHSSAGEPVCWRVLRSRQEVDVKVMPSLRASDGTSRLLVFLGIVLRPTPRAVAERGGPIRPHTRPDEGLYFWHIFNGSPADTIGLSTPGWLVQVDDEPTPSIDALLAIIGSGRLRGREWLRCRTTDAEGRETVQALQPDPTYWPTVELARRYDDDDGPLPRWSRVEHSDGS